MNSLGVTMWCRTVLPLIALGLWGTGVLHAAPVEAGPSPEALRAAYVQQVARRLELPEDEAHQYGALAVAMLFSVEASLAAPQYVVMVDRNPHVQAILIYLVSGDQDPMLIGASPVSTGRIGQFDHFETPTGVFEHTPDHPDFRAEGTKNKLGIRGYGISGMRVFDFGWQMARRGWGQGGIGIMRLQMHATDPAILERYLGQVHSKGCIRIPATLNRFLDHYGVLDAAYEEWEQAGKSMWVLSPDRRSVKEAGRYLIVIDTMRAERPLWSVTYAPR